MPSVKVFECNDKSRLLAACCVKTPSGFSGLFHFRYFLWNFLSISKGTHPHKSQHEVGSLSGNGRGEERFMVGGTESSVNY